MEKVKHEGVVVHVNVSGLGVVKDSGSDTHYSFTFDKIRGYRGERPKEIGLREGKHLVFYVDADEKVTEVVTAVEGAA